MLTFDAFGFTQVIFIFWVLLGLSAALLDIAGVRPARVFCRSVSGDPRRHAYVGQERRRQPVSDVLVSILIVNWNTREQVSQCLASLPNDIADEPVVRGDRRRQRLDRWFGRRSRLAPRIMLIRNDASSGTPLLSTRRTDRRAEFVLLLNSDVELTPGALAPRQFLLDCPVVGWGRPAVRESGRLTAAVSFPLPDLRDDPGKRKSTRVAGSCREASASLANTGCSTRTSRA